VTPAESGYRAIVRKVREDRNNAFRKIRSEFRTLTASS
jgi:hypothetical protein